MTENKNILFHKDKSTSLYTKQKKKTVTEFHIEVEDVIVLFND